MTKESQLYLSFFRRHFGLIFIPALLLGGSSYLFLSHQPLTTHLIETWELDYQAADINNQVLLTDELVSLLRSSNIQKSLSLDANTKLLAYRIGPDLLQIDLASIGAQSLPIEMKAVEKFGQDHFSLHQVGQPVTSQDKKAFTITVLGSFLIGFFIGITLSLTREYLHNF